MKRKLVYLAICLALCRASGVAFAGERKNSDYKKHPGYVNFDALNMFGEDEAKVEVFLKNPLLNLAAAFVKGEDPELYEILNKLKLVRVLVYDIDTSMARKVAEVSSETAKDLDNRGWERIVRVREDDERIDIYVKPSSSYDQIQGIVVMVVGDHRPLSLRLKCSSTLSICTRQIPPELGGGGPYTS